MAAHWQPLLDFVQTHQCDWSTEPDDSGDEWGIHQFDDIPHNRLLGPVFPRGGACGVLLKNGQPLVQWGDIQRPDMTFSVTKTYLALCAGIAFDRGLLPDLDEPVCKRLPDLGFSDAHNKTVTWRHLLQFTSEWQGSCFDVPEQIDRYRVLGLQPKSDESGRKGDARPLKAPGTYWEYNDVRINQFSLALMYLFERPLPEVFAETIMHEILASDSWHWHGYDNSWVTIGDRKMQSVPGGGHWGGGMVISAEDQAKVAQLLINKGQHNNKQLVSREWISLMTTPCPIAPFYGFFTWLNTDHVISTHASTNSFFAMGIGGQFIWHSPDDKIVAVIRWADAARFEELMRHMTMLVSSFESASA